MPEPLGSREIAGYVTSEAARETDLRKGIPVAIGAIDCVACALGVGGVEVGHLTVIVGSWGINELVIECPDFSRELMYILHSVPGKYLAVGGGVTSSIRLQSKSYYPGRILWHSKLA